MPSHAHAHDVAAVTLKNMPELVRTSCICKRIRHDLEVSKNAHNVEAVTLENMLELVRSWSMLKKIARDLQAAAVPHIRADSHFEDAEEDECSIPTAKW